MSILIITIYTARDLFIVIAGDDGDDLVINEGSNRTDSGHRLFNVRGDM